MWQASASVEVLKRRAEYLRSIRQFFDQRSVVEVDVPVLGARTVSDPHLSSLSLELNQRNYFLQTSPEFFLKRLLAHGCGSVYSMGKAFRQDEVGNRHNPEFTMLEWYRLGFDERQLAQEVVDLIKHLGEPKQVQFLSYAEAFEAHIGVNPHSASSEELESIGQQKLHVSWSNEPKNTWLDLLFSHLVEPNFDDTLTVVSDFPASQCALAKLGENEEGLQVAKRFEVYWRGIELANGYLELTDANIQRERFEKDLDERHAMGVSAVELDEKFLMALEAGIPECAGVALGVDRLLMCLLNKKSITEVMPFSFERL